MHNPHRIIYLSRLKMPGLGRVWQDATQDANHSDVRWYRAGLQRSSAPAGSAQTRHLQVREVHAVPVAGTFV